MNIFKKNKYIITDRDGHQHSFSKAEDLLYRIITDSKKSNYDWIASASELVRFCETADFPKQYAIQIKIAILNCFANLLQNENNSIRPKRTKGKTDITSQDDIDAVYDCYNSLFSITQAHKVRLKFLIEVIKSCSSARSGLDLPYHFGQTYIKNCDTWLNQQVEKYISQRNINFHELRKELCERFAEAVRNDEANRCYRDEKLIPLPKIKGIDPEGIDPDEFEFAE